MVCCYFLAYAYGTSHQRVGVCIESFAELLSLLVLDGFEFALDRTLLRLSAQLLELEVEGTLTLRVFLARVLQVDLVDHFAVINAFTLLDVPGPSPGRATL